MHTLLGLKASPSTNQSCYAQAAAAVLGPVKRDPRRLIKPTASAAIRAEARRATTTVPRDSGYIRHVAPRRTASWTGSS